MCRFGFSAIAFAVSVFASTAHCQELTNDELTALFSDTVYASVNLEGITSITATEADGTATLWWRFRSGLKVYPGTWRIQDNQYCREWEGIPGKRCSTVRKTGPHSYEMWSKNGFGDDQMFNRFHSLRKE